MRRVTAWTWLIVIVLVLPGPAVPAQTGTAVVDWMAASTQAGILATDTGVYNENFTTYTTKDYTDNAEWDIGQHVLRLRRTDGIDQSVPTAAVDSGRNVLVVWKDYRNGHYDIYARKLDINGNRLWADDVRVNTDNTNAQQDCPAVAVDGSGNALVVWLDWRDSGIGIYAQKLGASGNKLWVTDLHIGSDSWPAWEWAPGVAMDENGNAVIVWHATRNGHDDIYAQKLDASGHTLWAAAVRVNSDSGTAGQDAPVVAMDMDGNVIILWHDLRNGNSDIFAQKLSPNGNKLWAADVRVNSDSGTANQWNAGVAVDRNGAAAAVWQDYRNGDTDIYTQKLDVNGNRLWITDMRVNSDSGTADQYSPTVTIDGSDDAVVVWSDWRNGNQDIYAQKLSADGDRLWVTDIRVNSDSEAADHLSPAMVVDLDNNALIVWADYRSGDSDIYAQKVNTSGHNLWAADARVSPDSGTTDQYSPAVAMDRNGNTFTVWSDSRNGGWDVYVQKVDITGDNLWGADVQVNSVALSGHHRDPTPAVAVDESGTVFVAWDDYRSGYSDWDIYVQRLDTNGNKLWATDVLASSDSGTVEQFSPVLGLDDGGSVFVVWSDNRNGIYDIYCQRLSSNGTKQWATDIQVNSSGGIEGSWYRPAVAVDRSGNAIVAWMDYRNGNLDIYAQRIDALGNRLWTTDLRVNSDNGTADQYYPSIALTGSGNVIVVWGDSRSGNRDIYAQELDVSGYRLWATDVRVNSDSGTTSQYVPAVALDGSGNVVVVWHDGRNNKRDIYAQKLDEDRNKLWAADAQVNSGNGTADQHCPPAIAGGGDSTVVVWGDDRKGNADIFAQKISSVGGKEWLADVQIVDPDLFYLSTGSAQSHTVDSVTDNIHSATLTSDYQTNGGEVHFYLANDGGAHWAQVTPGVTRVFTTAGSDLRWRAVLSVDPIWRHRTPVVNSLRIEYSTQVPYVDDYEPDDDCLSQVQPIAVNGAVQAHTFHQYADEDWVWFTVVAGHTYVVQTSNTQANADTELELHAACPQPPLASDDNAFGNDARVTWQATLSGQVYVKVSNHTPSAYGPDTGYDLSVRTFTQPPVAVIVGGHDNRYSLQANIDYAADMTYRTFLNSGVPKANVRYFGPNPNRDVDGNGQNDDIYATATITNVREAVQDWSRTRGVALGVPFYVVLVDHGHYDQFLAAGTGGRVTATDLDLWLSNLEATSGTDNINVILEACHSGSFIDVTTLGPAEVSGRNRVVIASTSSALNAYPSAQGAYFSDVFWTGVGQNQDLKTAFERAVQAVGTTGLSQQPWLDDNGDAVADGRDGALARDRGLGSPFAGSPPVVDWVRVGPVSGGQATVAAQVRDDFGVAGVWTVVYPPDFVEPGPTQDGTTPVLDVPTATLTLAGADLYGTVYHGFTQTGQYRLVVYAQDGDGNQALPQGVQVRVGCVYLPLVVRNH